MKLPQSGGSPPQAGGDLPEEPPPKAERGGGGSNAVDLAAALITAYQHGGAFLVFIVAAFLLMVVPLFAVWGGADLGALSFIPWVGGGLLLACFTLFAAAFVTGRSLEKARSAELDHVKKTLKKSTDLLARQDAGSER